MPSEEQKSNMDLDYDIKAEKEKNTFGERLKEARHKRGWSLKTLTEKLEDYNIHIQTPAVNRWESGQTTPNAYQLFALCRLFEIEDGIRYFSGPLHSGKISLNETGLKKLEDYRNDLIASGKYNYIDMDNIEAEVEIAVYDFRTPAKADSFLESDNYRMTNFKACTVPYDADFAIIVSGDSMMPNYTEGQMVWVQKTADLCNNEIGIFILNDCAYMKIYNKVELKKDDLEDDHRCDKTLRSKIKLVSLNKKYAPISVGKCDDFRIIGRVLVK